MILPNSDISIMNVRNVLGYPSTDLGTLCTCANVNKYSRYRPGYWTIGTNQNSLSFVQPRGINYNDPRGTRSNGIAQEVYFLGDFRNYNSTARGFFTDGQNPREIIVSSSAGSTVSETVVFDCGEVDWFNEETTYHGRNNIQGMDQIVAVNTANGNVLGVCDKENLTSSGNRKRAEFSVNLSVPSDSYPNTYNIKFGLGTANKLRYYFPDSDLQITVKRISSPTYLIYLKNAAAGDALYAKVKSQLLTSDTTVSRLDIVPTTGGFNAGTDKLQFTSTDAQLTAYPSQNLYRVTSTRWQVTFDLIKQNATTGETLYTDTQTKIWATNGYGRFAVVVDLPSAARDNELYRIELTNFGTTTIQPYS